MLLQILWNRQIIALIIASILLSACADKSQPSSGIVSDKPEVSAKNNVASFKKGGQEYNPNKLMGRIYADIFNRLGRPDFAKREGNNEFIQYRGKDCVLDIFVNYSNPANAENSRDADILDKKQALARKSARVTHVNLRDRHVAASVPPALLRQCLYVLVETRPAQHRKALKQAKKQAKTNKK